jgi:peptidoglycan/LPS O-acetylase OafA/YrhL
VKFRTDIQALRGIAVSLVVLYHADLGVFKAGYLGVDIFFVISGFLITTLIRKEIERGQFSFSEFYFRRAKRLLPAAYTTFTLTAIAAPFILNAQELRDFSIQTIGAVTFAANIVLLFQSGYFAGAAELKPLLHTWSLSIEEQYYLLLPAFLVFVPRRFWKPGTLIIFLASLALCLAGLKYKPEWTFYLLPTRAWELGVGSLAAIYTIRGEWAHAVCKWLFWPSVALLFLIPAWPTGLPHPGVDAILVCLATVIVILRRHPLLDRLPVVRALARIGDVSYSLYLVHWPPFAFLRNAAVGPVTWQLSILTLSIGIVLGLLLYRFVELPARRLQLHPSRKLVLGGLATSLLVMGIPLAIARIPVSGPDFAHIRRPNVGFASTCTYDDSDFVPKPECRNSEQPAILVWGDSYAMHLVSGVAAASQYGVVQATRNTCGPFANLAPISNGTYSYSWAESCLKFNREVIDYLEHTESIKVVVISSPFLQYLKVDHIKRHWKGLRFVDGKPKEQEVSMYNVVMAMTETIDRIHAMGKKVVIVSPPPGGGFEFNIGTCAERKSLGKLVIGAPTSDCSIPILDYQTAFAPTLEFLQQINKITGVPIVSFDPALCDETRCAHVIDEKLVYVDFGHLTYDASVILMKKVGMQTILDIAAATDSFAASRLDKR